MAKQALVMRFRKNDLDASKGKQIEFNSAKIKNFFHFTEEKVRVFFIYKDLGNNPDLDNTKIEINLSLSPARSDYKIYQNEDGEKDLKDFFLEKLNLTDSNVDDYFALKKNSEINYELFYFPKTTQMESIYSALNLSSGYLIIDDGKPEVAVKTNLILYGPPGTGKTYKMQNEFISKYSETNRFVTTFHQSFSYEEFVEGLKAFSTKEKTSVYYDVEPGIFYQACERAAEVAGYEKTTVGEKEFTALENMIQDNGLKLNGELTTDNTVLLCIDEINRANVSAVFGDLISLIEPSKRIGQKNQMVVKLPYSKKSFAVPANLRIIGTMNTADRSIQLLDSALRRRFDFVELLPDYEAIEDDTAKNVLKSINNRIRALIGKNYQIGHSYFIGKTTADEIFEVLDKNVIPLLEEYFYEETEKIRVVLNDSVKNYFYEEDSEARDSIPSELYDDDNKIYVRSKSEASKNDILTNIIG